VDEAGRTMGEIVDSIRRVTDIMNEIAAASQEQTAGIEQINSAVAQMDEVTQNNASLVEEAAAAAQSLQNQADSLTRLVSVFRIREEDNARRAASIQIEKLLKASLPKAATTRSPVAKRPIAASTAGSGDEWDEF
jgi:uncharacterized phage infection (PIP) family protein YhgE